MFVFGGYRHERELGDCKELHLSRHTAPHSWRRSSARASLTTPHQQTHTPTGESFAHTADAAATSDTHSTSSPPSSECELRGSGSEEDSDDDGSTREDAPFPGADAHGMSLQLLLALLSAGRAE